VLIGGVGGGREALALAQRGYQVVAFDPARALISTLERALGDRRPSIEVLVGRYEDLPVLQPPDGRSPAADLRQRPRFDAAVLGWASFSHIRSDAGRIDALRGMGALTAGPIFLSYFSPMDERVSSALRQGSFALRVGFFRQLSEEEIRRLIAEAGLEVVLLQHDLGWPCAVLRRRRDAR